MIMPTGRPDPDRYTGCHSSDLQVVASVESPPGILTGAIVVAAVLPPLVLLVDLPLVHAHLRCTR